jgi:hypothetical protein
MYGSTLDWEDPMPFRSKGTPLYRRGAMLYRMARCSIEWFGALLWGLGANGKRNARVGLVWRVWE